MGCGVTDNGISVQFCHEDGRPDGAPIYGRYAHLCGKAQECVIAAGQPAGPGEQGPLRGSDDWLTLIAVADSELKLKEIVTQSGGNCDPPHTSHSSHRACIELHIGGLRQKFSNRITIASGPIVSLKDPIKIDVVHVKVLPEGTKLNELDKCNPLVREFIGGAVVFQNLLRPSEGQ